VKAQSLELSSVAVEMLVLPASGAGATALVEWEQEGRVAITLPADTAALAVAGRRKAGSL